MKHYTSISMKISSCKKFTRCFNFGARSLKKSLSIIRKYWFVLESIRAQISIQSGSRITKCVEKTPLSTSTKVEEEESKSWWITMFCWCFDIRKMSRRRQEEHSWKTHHAYLITIHYIHIFITCSILFDPG